MIWPANYDPAERDNVYKTFSLSGWPGRSGHDAPMIALDALLGSGSDWEELMSRAAFHGGEWRSEGENGANVEIIRYNHEGGLLGLFSLRFSEKCIIL